MNITRWAVEAITQTQVRDTFEGKQTMNITRWDEEVFNQTHTSALPREIQALNKVRWALVVITQTIAGGIQYKTKTKQIYIEYVKNIPKTA